jgi:hypothetical protein
MSKFYLTSVLFWAVYFGAIIYLGVTLASTLGSK